MRAFDLGFDEMRQTVVRRLRAGSQAALAGGDQIDALDNLQQSRKEQDAMLSLQITRDGQQRRVSYLPRAPAAPMWHWDVPAAGTPAPANCGY